MPFDELDGFEGFVHVADCQEEAEVHHGFQSAAVGALQPHEVAHDASCHARLLHVRLS